METLKSKLLRSFCKGFNLGVFDTRDSTFAALTHPLLNEQLMQEFPELGSFETEIQNFRQKIFFNALFQLHEVFSYPNDLQHK